MSNFSRLYSRALFILFTKISSIFSKSSLTFSSIFLLPSRIKISISFECEELYFSTIRFIISSLSVSEVFLTIMPYIAMLSGKRLTRRFQSFFSFSFSHFTPDKFSTETFLVSICSFVA